MSFPINVSAYKPLKLNPATAVLSAADRQQLATNVQVMRDVIVFFTAVAGAKGLSGHTGGAYSIVPEALLVDGFIRGGNTVYPVLFDEAGHRVALQYAMAALNGDIPLESLLHYREFGHGLFGHPELDPKHGAKFSSGRLGHLWPFVNGVAKANPEMTVFMFGSDGSQMEGDDAEAARFAVAQGLNVKLLLDDNNVTISGHPKEYLAGYDLAKTMGGHGLTVDAGDGEDLDALFARVQRSLVTMGPVALVNRRLMAPGVPGIEGSPKGHEVVKAEFAAQYLTARGQQAAADYLGTLTTPKTSVSLMGVSDKWGSNRTEFGNIVNGLLDKMTPDERKAKVLVVDSDLEGSCGFNLIHKAHPEVFVSGGVMERGNFSAAAGFGFEKGRQGIFGTFSAFSEMIISEATMARLNHANAICHFSHAGVDEIADNTCHFGINVFFVHNALEEDNTNRLYFAADALQLKSLVETIFHDPGLRYVFTTRSKVPYICKEDGSLFFDPANGYSFAPGKDEVIREGSAGYVVSYGEMLYRSLDAVDRLRKEGLDVGLINKPTLNLVDEAMMAKLGKAPFVLVVEGQNRLTGLGVRFGSWLLERGLAPKYAYMGATRVGNGGLEEQIVHQGLAPADILAKIKTMA